MEVLKKEEFNCQYKFKKFLNFVFEFKSFFYKISLWIVNNKFMDCKQ